MEQAYLPKRAKSRGNVEKKNEGRHIKAKRGIEFFLGGGSAISKGGWKYFIWEREKGPARSRGKTRNGKNLGIGESRGALLREKDGKSIGSFLEMEKRKKQFKVMNGERPLRRKRGPLELDRGLQKTGGKVARLSWSK